MAVNEQKVMTSHNLLNYSGLLYMKGQADTPFLSMMSGRNRTANSWEFATSLGYTPEAANAQPAITETQSLTAPQPTHITRQQNTNYCQIFHEAVAISYGKQSSMGQLSGLNIAGQTANPANELDFQVANKMLTMRNKVEYSFINGVAAKGTHDDVAYKTGGLSSVITTNTKAAGSKPLTYWAVAEMLDTIAKAGGDPNNLIIMAQMTHLLQLNADVKAQGLTIVPGDRTVAGIAVSYLMTPTGSIGFVANRHVKAGEALFVNVPICSPVELPVPGKGNMFLEPLAKKGAADEYQLYGQMGLDYGAEWYHGKMTGLATTFTAPDYAMKVYQVNGTGTGTGTGT